MDSSLSPKQTDPRDVMIARLEEANARAYEQFAHKVAPVDKQPDAPHDAPHHPTDDPQTSSSAFRPAGDRSSLGGPKRRGLFGFLLLACIGVTAIVWQSSYSETVKQLIAGWTRQFAPILRQPPGKPEFPTQASSTAVQADAAKSSATAAQNPELEQLLRTMPRDLATLGQEIEQLKANQRQIVRDNAKLAEQLEASQEQMARVIAKASRRKQRARTPER